ncbi:MAG: hypothetical protein HC857_15510 [Synechococcales cyanobacterium RU_4_20]|nr:hypothetical protein [Synechococcales cyanobacterium RU_4_20]
MLKPALSQARTENHLRSEAIALGLLGEWSEQQAQWDEAQRLTQSALMRSQQIGAIELSYRWQWQLGRILKQRGRKEEAIAAYASAVNQLDALKDDWVRLNPDVQLSFRAEIDPVYRDYLDLLLSSDSQQTTLAQVRRLGQAQFALDQLHSLELGSFLGVPCDLAASAVPSRPTWFRFAKLTPRLRSSCPLC